MAFSVFEYFYRDASNYKSYGKIWLLGSVTESQCNIIKSCFQFDDFLLLSKWVLSHSIKNCSSTLEELQSTIIRGIHFLISAKKKL